MCRQCHSRLSDEFVISNLKDSLQNPQFKDWNTTSLSHVLIAIGGTNGKEAHDLGLELAEKFYKWYLGYTNGAWEMWGVKYLPPTGLEPFPWSTDIRKSIDDANAHYLSTVSDTDVVGPVDNVEMGSSDTALGEN